MQYQILRTQKLKSLVTITNSLKHAYRTQHTPNADETRAHLNQTAKIKDFETARQSFVDELGKCGKIRKDAVLAIEFVVSASPAWFEGKTIKEQNDYFNKAILFLKDEFGADNFICAGVHRDEKTPHLWGYFIPKVDGKLNCKKLLGGTKNRMAILQTDFHERVSKGFGLERGVSGTGRKHTTLNEYNKELERRDLEIKKLREENSNLRALIEINRDVIEEKMKRVHGESAVLREDLKSVSAGRERDLPNIRRP